ncbi:acid-sensing ion channel 4-A [Coccinella septempunctata]|uniref:acid-sensing ion channel 4-A n=1 Tax=Coccinella septempunctata TaxID=41139 RepID=UPI001D07DD60|nr:acid-sensing ion channel 4-A [Coccinella septempunctata]
MVFVDFNTCFTDPKQFIRLIILVTCVCVTIYELEICIRKLVHPPVTTLNMLKLNETMKYPAITICRKPAYKTQLFLKYGMRRRTELSNKGAFSKFKFDEYTLDDFMNASTYSVDETLQFYGYNSIVGSKNMNVTSDLYLKLGNCHTFSTTNVSSKFSLEGGMVFYLGSYAVTRNLNKNSKDYVFAQDFSEGYNVFIHDTSEFITDQSEQMETYSQFIFIEPGESIYLNIEVKEFHMVDHTDEPCVSIRNYSQSRCLEECMHDKLMREYSCSLPWMKGRLIYPSCNNSEIIDEMNNMLNSKRKEFSEDCICSKPCHLYLYLPKVMQRKTANTSPFSLLYLSYTSNIVTTVVQVVSYDWSAFIADLGGSLGLFLGLSVIGLIEVIEMFLRLIFRKRRQKIREEERIASLRDLRMVGRLLEYLLAYRNRPNGEVVLRNCQNQKY